MRTHNRLGLLVALAVGATALAGAGGVYAKPTASVGGTSPTNPGSGSEVNCNFTVAGCDQPPDVSQPPDPGGFTVNINTPPPVSPCKRDDPNYEHCLHPTTGSAGSGSSSSSNSSSSSTSPLHPIN